LIRSSFLGEFFFKNRSSLSLGLGADFYTFPAFNKIKIGSLKFFNVGVNLRYDYRFAKGWYIGTSYSYFGNGSVNPYSDLSFFLGHRGLFKGNELYLEGSIIGITETTQKTRYQGLIGIVVPTKMGTDLSMRPSIFLQHYIDRESNPDFPITYRTLSGLNWRLSASVLYKQMFAITPYINLNARYYTVTTSPVRVESDVHEWTAGLTLHYYWDKNNIQDKLLKFY
jgi:hypothetical protein